LNRERIAIRTLLFSVISNFCLAVIKWATGYWGNSYALIADAIESTTDIFSTILVLMGVWYINRPPDKNHPYGHGRAEPLFTFIVVVFLVISAGIIVRDSIQNIYNPHPLPHPYTLFVLGIIILWKEIAYRRILYHSRMIHSGSLAADAWHHRSDAITSGAAWLGIAVALLLGPGYEAADDWAALLAALFILYNSYRIFRPALSEIMDEDIHEELILQIRAIASQVPGVVDTEKCFVRKAGMQYHIDLHAIVDGNLTVRKGHDIAHALQQELKNRIPEVNQVLIHIEPDGMDE
jgi:cation diffusion facilitator family transporter